MRTFYLSILLIGAGFAAGCGGGVSKTSTTTTTTTGSGSGSNVLAISVDGGPTANVANGSIYPNAAFASATVAHLAVPPIV